MSFTRIRVCSEVTNKLIQMKGKTGLTPNFLSRIAFCVSLNEAGVPDPKMYDEEGQEFNRYTLTGEWDLFFISLLKERLVLDGLDSNSDLSTQFRAHLNRGIISIYPRIRGLTDLVNLIPKEEAMKTHEKEFMKSEDDN